MMQNQLKVRLENLITRKDGLLMGRNDLCFCGSGKKQKKCHPNINEDSVAAKIIKLYTQLSKELEENVYGKKNIKCQKGCNACCKDYFAINEVEFAVIIINYIISEEDLIKNHSFKIINFFHDLLDKQKLLMYNQIGVRGVLLNCENTDIKDAEIIFEMIEECQLDWVVIGGGEHISIGQRRYEKFVNKINNKSNWTPISL